MSGWQLSWTSERSIWVHNTGDGIDPVRVGQLAGWIASQRPDAVCSAVPAAGGVLIEFNAMRFKMDDAWAMTASMLESFEFDQARAGAMDSAGAREIVVPVCYDERVAPDIREAAQRLGIEPERVIELHTALAYRVVSMGFMPGFGYLSTLDDGLRLPRKETPRTRVPAGSVAIAEDMTAIYPHQSAGGWHLIGRTSMRLFDPGHSEPSLMRVGDCVRFERITLDAYHEQAPGYARDGA